MGIISTSPEPEKTWHAARWAYRRLVEDALLLHGQDPELGPLFEQAIAVDGLSFQMEEDFLAERGMVALIDTAKRTLTSASRDSLRWHVGLDENVQRAYLAAITDLLDLLEQEHGRERVGIVSISEDKNWVVARWIFLRLLEDAKRLYANSVNLAYVLDMAISQRGLYLHGWREDLAKEAWAAIFQTAQATLKLSPQDTLQWHQGLAEHDQRAYLSSVANLIDLLKLGEQSRSERNSDLGPSVTEEERSAIIDCITEIWKEGRGGETSKRDVDDHPQQ